MAKPKKFFAVKRGLGGPNIYDSWVKCKPKVNKFKGALHQGFYTLEEAQAWLQDTLSPSSSQGHSQASSTQESMSPAPSAVPPNSPPPAYQEVVLPEVEG